MSMGEMHQFCPNRSKSLFWNRACITSFIQLPLQTIIQNDWQNDRQMTGKVAAVKSYLPCFKFPAKTVEREFDASGVDGG
jgi:hypothetical protein